MREKGGRIRRVVRLCGRLGGPKPVILATNPALREYAQERLAGTVTRPAGAPVPGPQVPWIGRRHGRRADRRRATAWSPHHQLLLIQEAGVATTI